MRRIAVARHAIRIRAHRRILGPLLCAIYLVGCDNAQPGKQAPEMPTVGPSGHQNVVALVSAATQSDGSARAQLYGVYSTGPKCVAARNWYLKRSPDEFRPPQVDLACIQDTYDFMPWNGPVCGTTERPCNPNDAH